MTNTSDAGGHPDPRTSATPTEAIGDALMRAELRARMFGGGAPVRVGRFDVGQKLGEGGMGVVYAARDVELGRPIALKLLHAAAGDPTTLAKEARALAQLNHPNVVTIHDVGEVEGHSYIAMELVEGKTLRVWCPSANGWAAIVSAFAQAGDGLAAAHEVGIVHRDFKPDNAIVGADARVRVVDFGLARSAGALAGAPSGQASGAPVTGLTATGALRGTPAYMAPEQALGRSIDARSDQFAFCVALFEMLAGYRPFAGDDFHALATAAVDEDVQPVPSESAVPPAVWSALRRGLAAAPERRFATMSELLAVLRDACAAPPRRRAFAPAVLAVVGALAVAGITASVLVADTEGDEQAPPPVRDVAVPVVAAEDVTPADVPPILPPILPPVECMGFRAPALAPAPRKQRAAFLSDRVADWGDGHRGLPEALLWLAEFRMQAHELEAACDTLTRLAAVEASGEYVDAGRCWHDGVCIAADVTCAPGHVARSVRGCEPERACAPENTTAKAVEGACRSGEPCCALEMKFAILAQTNASRAGQHDGAAAAVADTKAQQGCDAGIAAHCALLAKTIAKRQASDREVSRGKFLNARACQLGHLVSCDP